MDCARKEAIISAALSEKKKPNFKLFKLEGTSTGSIRVIRDLLVEVFGLKSRNVGGLYYCPNMKVWMFFGMPEEIPIDGINGIRITKWSTDDLEKCPRLLIRYAGAISANKNENSTFRQLARKLIECLVEKNQQSILDVIAVQETLIKSNFNYLSFNLLYKDSQVVKLNKERKITDLLAPKEPSSDYPIIDSENFPKVNQDKSTENKTVLKRKSNTNDFKNDAFIHCIKKTKVFRKVLVIPEAIWDIKDLDIRSNLIDQLAANKRAKECILTEDCPDKDSKMTKKAGWPGRKEPGDQC